MPLGVSNLIKEMFSMGVILWCMTDLFYGDSPNLCASSILLTWYVTTSRRNLLYLFFSSQYRYVNQKLVLILCCTVHVVYISLLIRYIFFWEDKWVKVYRLIDQGNLLKKFQKQQKLLSIKYFTLPNNWKTDEKHTIWSEKSN